MEHGQQAVQNGVRARHAHHLGGGHLLHLGVAWESGTANVVAQQESKKTAFAGGRSTPPDDPPAALHPPLLLPIVRAADDPSPAGHPPTRRWWAAARPALATLLLPHERFAHHRSACTHREEHRGLVRARHQVAAQENLVAALRARWEGAEATRVAKSSSRDSATAAQADVGAALR